ncbi:MAG: TraR/DksA family transcriptional regulator [Cumulibacter sp.]
MAARIRTAQSSGDVTKPARKVAKKATPAKKAPVAKKTSAAKKATPTKAATAKAAPKPARSRLSADDRAEFTALITTELARVREEYELSMAALDDLKKAGQDSAGDDVADAGAKTFEREHEMSLANNRLDLMAQMERALRRVEEGSYGVCESCGKMIPKARLKAFPQATLCVECKSREERR